MICIGIDPGKSGAYAVIGVYPDPVLKPFDDLQFARDMRDVATLIERTALSGEKWRSVVCVEKVGVLPREGVTSCFTFGKNAGYIEGVLTALGIPYQLIPPKKWKSEFGLNSDKAKSVEVCKKLFPDVSLRRTERCRKDDDNMAEALLMAEYAKRRM